MITTAFYLHQFNRGYRERSYREFAQTARAHGIDQIWFKSHQGGNYSATWDPSPLAFSDASDCVYCYDECEDEGVQAVFWSVPQGNTWQQDAQFSIDIAIRTGSGVTHVDLENFKDFWNAPRWGVTGQPPYFQMLKDADLIVDVSAVGRFGEPELTPWDEIVDLVDSVWTQSYAVDFKQPAARVVADDLNAMLRVGIPIEKLGVIQGHNSTRAELEAGWEVAQNLGVTRCAIWVWDYASLTPFEFLRDLKAGQPVPVIVDREEAWRELHAAASRLEDITQPGVLVLDDGTDISDEGTVLAEVGRILQIVDRHRAVLVGE